MQGQLIEDTDEGKARIRFVTEGEASLHACVLNGLAADVLSVSLKLEVIRKRSFLVHSHLESVRSWFRCRGRRRWNSRY